MLSVDGFNNCSSTFSDKICSNGQFCLHRIIENMSAITFMAIGFKGITISIIMACIVLGISLIVGVIQAEFE